MKENDITELKAMLDQYKEFANAGDFEGWISLWDEKGVQMPSDNPSCVGISQITERMRPLFEEMTNDIKLLEIEDVKIYGDLGLTRCSYTLAVTPLNSDEKIVVVPNGKALTFYQRQSDNTWKIIYDCVNSNVPPSQE
jgi:ketosteroid isomerase-like protein